MFQRTPVPLLFCGVTLAADMPEMLPGREVRITAPPGREDVFGLCSRRLYRQTSISCYLSVITARQWDSNNMALQTGNKGTWVYRCRHEQGD